MTFLNDFPMRSDALMIWSYSRARGCSLRRILRTRAAQARRIAQVAGISPSQAVPGKVLSDASLRRYRRAGLATLLLRLTAANVPVR
jgi:hypothetical protein